MNKFIDIVKVDLKNHISYPYLPDEKIKLSIYSFIKSYIDIDFRVVFLFRFSQFLLNKNFKKLSLLIYFRLKSRYNIDISPYCKIENGFKIVHAFNIVIGSGAKIGSNFVCFNNVNIGNKKIGWRQSQRSDEMPTIGKNVVVAPQNIIVGNINIDNNISIHANQVISNNINNNDKTLNYKFSKILNDQ